MAVLADIFSCPNCIRSYFFIKAVLHSSYDILLNEMLCETPSKGMIFLKNRRSKSNLESKICQILYFICEVIFDKLSELQQISCIIPH